MTIEPLLSRPAALEQQSPRLPAEYLRLGTELQDRLQGADRVIATGHARPTVPPPPTEQRRDRDSGEHDEAPAVAGAYDFRYHLVFFAAQSPVCTAMSARRGVRSGCSSASLSNSICTVTG